MDRLRLSDRSLLVEAQADDPDLGAWLASQPDPPARPPALSEWTPETARLADIYDRLGELVAVTVAAAGERPGRVHPAPRPRTAIDRGRAAARKARHTALVQEVQEAQARWAATHGTGG